MRVIHSQRGSMMHQYSQYSVVHHDNKSTQQCAADVGMTEWGMGVQSIMLYSYVICGYGVRPYCCVYKKMLCLGIIAVDQT